MVIELVVNLLILGFSIFCFFYVGATMPQSPANELGAEQWPQALLILLIIALVWNLIKFFRSHKREEILSAFRSFGPDTLNFMKSKLFIGMIMVLAMALMYEPVGFIFTSLLFLAGYGILLGERRVWMIILSSVVITAILYIGFAVFLGVMLPRGQVPFLRNFALFVESLIPA
jgi:hypothetical protein